MLILARHGQTAANAAGALLGRSDLPLTDLGERQAAAVGAALRGVDRVISSPLQRARRTAEAIGRPVEIDDRWIEVDYGDFEGQPLSDVPAEVWQRWRADATYVPPHGESLAACGARVRAACEELVDEARDRDIVVVSHVSPIKAAVAWAVGAGDDAGWRLFLDVAAICRIGIGPHGPVLRSFNDREHLRDVVASGS